MSKHLKIAMIIAAISVLASQVYYFTAVYPKTTRQVAMITQELADATQQVKMLEEALKRLPHTKQELEDTKLEVVSLIQRMPSYASNTKELSDMLASLSRSQFTNIRIEQGETIQHQYEETTFLEKCYTLTYTAPFSASKQFVENLNSAYSLINIKGFHTDNSVQTDQDSQAAYKLVYGEQFKELVETKLEIAFLINPQLEKEEMYDASINMLSNSSNALMNLEVALQSDSENYYMDQALDIERLNVQREGESTAFKLLIETDENNRDYYQLSGPTGQDTKQQTRATLKSKQDVTVILRITQEGYQLILKAADGSLEQVSEMCSIKQPQLLIQAEKIQGDHLSQKVYVQIENETEQVMVVDIEGSMLGNLHIYNEEGIEVKRGGVQGKLIVR